MDTLDLGSWFILRMASSDTLRVKDALCKAGLNVWTPVEVRAKRKPRTRAIAEGSYALMPSYAFAHVQDLETIMRLAMMPRQDMPRFSVFLHQGGIPLISEEALGPLRQEERRCLSVFERAKRKVTANPVFGIGQEVTVPEGPFQGMTGIVESSGGQYSLVRFTMFGKVVSVKIAPLLIQPDVPSDAVSIHDKAARAA